MSKIWKSAYCERCDKLGFDKCLCPKQPFYPHFILTRRSESGIPYGDLWAVEGFLAFHRPLPTGWYEDGFHFMIGPPAADLLHICLAGHRFGTPGRDASPDLARQARAHLAAIAPWPGGYWLANRVVMHWGGRRVRL